MKNTLLTVLMISLSLLIKAQPILKDPNYKVKYKVKTTDKYIESIVSLQCGDKTNKDVKFTIYTEKLQKSKIDSLYDYGQAVFMNYLTELKCKNKFSWKPTNISIMVTSRGEISATMDGSAENTYGSRGSVTNYFTWEEGMFKELDAFLER